jgi:3-oxoacyl-[acyl-carrier-protein] synthase-3
LANLIRAKVSALGTFVPPRLLTNADLEKMVETSDQWILERTGIRQRHIVDKGVASSHLAVEAAKKALSERGIEGKDVEAIFLATVTPDMMFPATACLVQDRLERTRRFW